MEDLRDLDYGQYVSEDVPGYIEIGDELIHIKTALRAGENLLQYGPQGIGKTLSFEHIAREEGVPYIPFDCSKDTKRSQLLVQTTFGIDDDGNKKVEFIPAALPKGMIAANEYGRAIVVLEEINSLSPNLQKLVNRATDYSNKIEIPEAGGMVKLDDDAELMVGATMNPSSVSGGVFDLNDDLRSRFNELERGFPNNNKLQEVLKINGVPNKVGQENDIRQQIASFVESVHSHAEKGKVSYEFSPRDAVRLGRMWEKYYDEVQEMDDDPRNEAREALRFAIESSVEGKFREKGERDVISEDVSDCFAIQTY